MKKILALLLVLAMVLSFAACGTEKQAEQEEEQQVQEEQKEVEEKEEEEETSELPEIKNVTGKFEYKDFCFTVNGNEVKNADCANLNVYKISVSTTNSKGVTSDSTYSGYKLADILDLCGLKDVKSVKVVASDGYESSLSADLIYSDYTLVAIEKDKAQSEDGTIWVAPCSSAQGNVYSKLVVGFTVE